MQDIYEKAEELHETMKKASDILEELYEKHHVMTEIHYKELKHYVIDLIIECIVIKLYNMPF